MFCRNCGFKLPDEARFCFNCGEKTPVQEGVRCPSCSELLPVGAKFCRLCGNAVTAPTAPVASDSDETVFAGEQAVPTANETVLINADNSASADEDEPTLLLSGCPQDELVAETAQTMQSEPVAEAVQTALPIESEPAVQMAQPIPSASVDTGTGNIQLPSFLGTGGVQSSAPAQTIQAPPPAPRPVPRRKKKRGGAAAAIVIILLLLAAAAVAVYFMIFSDNARIEKLTEQAELCLDNDDYKGAAEAYSECVLIGTADPEIYLALSDAYLETDERDKALDALKKGYAATSDEQIWERLTALEDEIENSDG